MWWRAMLLFFAFIVVLQAAPQLQWAPLAGLSKPMKIKLQHLRRSRCLPASDEVTMPVYPAAVAIGLNWGRVKPLCVRRDGWQDLGSLVLATVDDETQVAAWYASNLDTFAQYRSERDLLFIKASIEDFLWKRDYYKYPNISIRRASGEWDSAGYTTIIELNRPSLN